MVTPSGAVTTTLINSLTTLATDCAGGVPSTITSSFSAVSSAATAFKADSVVAAQSAASTAISSVEGQIKVESDNITASGLNISAAASSGIAGVLAMVNNLHDYGVDRDKLNYNQLFAGLVQSNAGGDAVKASLAEGKNINVQAQYSVPIGTKIAQ